MQKIEVIPPGKRLDLNRNRAPSIKGLADSTKWSAKYLYQLRKLLMSTIDPESAGAELEQPWQIELIARMGRLHDFSLSDLTTPHGSILMPSLWRFYQKRNCSDYEYWAMSKAATFSGDSDTIKKYVAMHPSDFFIDLYLEEIKAEYTADSRIQNAKFIGGAA